MGDLQQKNAANVTVSEPSSFEPDAISNSSNQKTRILKNELLLHEAVIKNEPEAVKKVLAETVDVNSRNNYGRAPIHWAASRGSTEIMEMLINADCDIEAMDKYGMRSLHMAAWYGHLEAVKMLINAGADVSSITKKNYTLLMCGARGNNSSIIEYFTNTIKTLNSDATDHLGATALHHAAISGNPDVITALSNIPEIKLDFTDNKGQTPLHYACNEGHTKAAEICVKLGANGDIRDNEGNTPLHLATRLRHTEVAQVLLKNGADARIFNELGLAAIHIAASQGCKGILNLIIDYNESIINKQCSDGNTPLHLACQSNQVETVEILIQRGSDINNYNSKLQTPIHISAEMGHTDVCKLLLAAGANIEQKEKSGRTPLFIAAKGSFTAIVDMIIKTARLEYPSNLENENDELNPSRDKSTIEPCGKIAENVRLMLWRLAHKHFDPGDWKKLAFHWAFTQEQIQAIEHHYTGASSYKEHGYRLLMIWASSLSPNTKITKELQDALYAIDKKNIADSLTKKFEQINEDKSRKCCHTCTLT